MARRGVYFFFEKGEVRSTRDVTNRLRVVRVGTHALGDGEDTSLWSRLRSHRGVAKSGGGNHRGSIFRLLVGAALSQRESDLAIGSWGQGKTAPRAVLDGEHLLECRVSDLIRQMPLLWVEVPDDPGRKSIRGLIERNAVALLSNLGRQAAIDPASTGWLGHHCSGEPVRRSGLWNNHHVIQDYDPQFLDVLAHFVAKV